jgi:fluoroquinolone resistance protein
MDGCRFQDTFFDECKIVGGEFFKCDDRFFTLQFKNSILMGCNFSDLKMKKASFWGSKVKDCHFNHTFLVEVDFRETDLSGSIFHHADLSKADFRDAKNYSIDPQTNTLKKASFSIPEALSLLNFFDIKIT